MPTARLDQDVFAAGGTVATDWAQAGGNAQVSVAAGAQVRRGLNLDLGIQALASVDASVGKFLSAEVSGQASASASVTAQIQAPMNLFQEIGFAVRLQAIAELAAAVQVGLGLKIGDFLELAERDQQMRGLPIELLRVFLSEVNIKAGVYAKAALTAQAYAQLVVTGTAIAQPAKNIKPGFNIVAGAGVGLKAGAGFRVFAAMEIDDFSRFVARSVDVLVEKACDELKDNLPSDGVAPRILLDAARPLFKTVLRTSYELGEYLALNAPAATASGAQDVALRCAQVALEEGQRFLLKGLTDAGFSALEATLRTWVATLSQAQWDRTLSARRSLASHLQAFPAEPFEGTPANETYWNTLVARLVDLTAAALGGTVDVQTQRLISVLWSAAQLALVANRRVVRADARLSVIGQPPRQAKAAFSGNLTTQPPTLVRDHIRSSLPSPPAAGALKLDHIVEFLAADAALDFLRQHQPGVDRFLTAMTGPLGSAANDVGRTILRNIGSVIASGSGQPDAQATLAAIADGLRTFMSAQIHDELAPVLRNRLASRPDLRSYFDEVFLPTTDFTLETVFGVVLDWPRRGADREALKEALSGVLMKLVGRSLVVTTDIMLATAQAQMHGILNGLADSVDAPNGIVKQLSRAANLPVPASEIAELTADALRIGAEVLGPLDEAQRSKIRSLMYEVIDPLPSTAGAGFLQELGDGAFIPNNDAMMALAAELAAVGGERFLQFVTKLIELIGTKILEELAEVLEAAQRQVQQWVDDAQQALEDMQRQLGQLLADIERLAREVAEQFDQAAENLLGALTPLATNAGRRKFRSKLAAGIVDQALAVLTDNHVYRSLAPPDLKRAMRGMARDAVEEALDNDVIDGVLDIVGELAEELDSIMDDVRELDPDRDLAQQIGNLLINRLTDAIYDNLGRDPHIRVAIEVNVLGVRHRISLGRVDVPADAIVDGLRRAVRELDAFEDAVRDAARSLSAAFVKEARLQEAEAERADVGAKRERLGRQRAALDAAPRGVRILSPTPGAVAQGEVRVRIELQGLSREAVLDEDDRPNSVHVFLNGQELPLNTFSVAELGSAPEATPEIVRKPGRFDPRADLALRPHWAASKPDKVGAKGTPRGGLRALDASLVKGQSRKTGKVSFTLSGADSLANIRGNRMAALAAAAGPGGVRARPVVPKPPAPTAPPPRRGDRRIGAPLTVTQIDRLTVLSPAGIVLSCTVLGARLEEGMNTLIVSITPPGGRRVEASCVFFVEAGPAQPTKPKPGESRLPRKNPRNIRDLTPQKIAGKFALAPKKDRQKTVAAQKKTIVDRGLAKRTKLMTVLPTAVKPKRPPAGVRSSTPKPGV